MVKAKHYLVTLGLKSHENLHSYIITNDYNVVERIRDAMLDKADELGGVTLPIILETVLGDGEKVVRDYLFSHVPGSKQLIEKATNFHWTMWAMPDGCADDENLMELH